jgi:hypothetical protein
MTRERRGDPLIEHIDQDRQPGKATVTGKFICRLCLASRASHHGTGAAHPAQRCGALQTTSRLLFCVVDPLKNVSVGPENESQHPV